MCVCVCVCFCVNSRWEHLRQQFLCSLFFHLQLLCSLPDEILQVGTVLLQHPQHGVNDIGLLTLVDCLELLEILQKKM